MKRYSILPYNSPDINPIALKMAKTPYSFGHSECSRVKECYPNFASVLKMVAAGNKFKRGQT